MRQATIYPPLTRDECDHGERMDRTTSTGEPICALCRTEARRRPVYDPNAIDAAALAARDDLWDDEPDHTPGDADALLLAALFARDSGHRVSRMIDQWQHAPGPEPAGILF